MSPYLMWAVLGLGAGILAKLLLPGKNKGGLITTMLIGIGGSFLGGYLGQQVGLTTEPGAFSVVGFVSAIVGAVVLLLALRVFRFLI